MSPTRQFHRVQCCIVAWLALTTTASGIYWNNDPTLGFASPTGLLDRVDWFPNVHVIQNQFNNTRGTTTLLDHEWALTARHVVQGSSYSTMAPANQVYVNVGGVRYYADQIYFAPSSADFALVRLRGGVNSAIDITGQINSTFDEAGRIMHLGGYGFHGIISTPNVTGTASGSVSFHRAYNVGAIASGGSAIRITANSSSQLVTGGLLEGIAGPGDSGGPMFAFYGRGTPTPQSNISDWRLVGVTATSTASTSGASWNGFSDYVRVANHAGWISSTRNSYPAPGPAMTGPWDQHQGSGLFDSGGDRISVTGSNAAPAVHATIGPEGAGYILDSIGDTLSLTAILDTTLSTGLAGLRYGLFDDAAGSIAGDVLGGTPWRGYLVGNATQTGAGVMEKGPNGGGVGRWWSDSGADTAPLISRGTVAQGSFTGNMPAGRYALALDYTREADGLRIDWSTTQVNAANEPTGVYSHSGSVLDLTPASDDWTYNRLGVQLFGGSFSGAIGATIILDDVDVSFLDVVSLTGDFNGDGIIDAADFTTWRDQGGTSDEFSDWKGNFGAVANGSDQEALTAAVPEPAGWLLLLIGATLGWRVTPLLRAGRR